MAGLHWTNIVDGASYVGSQTSSLKISPAPVQFNAYRYQCVVSHAADPPITSNFAVLTVNSCSVSGIVQYNNVPARPLANVVVSVNGLTVSSFSCRWFIHD